MPPNWGQRPEYWTWQLFRSLLYFLYLIDAKSASHMTSIPHYLLHFFFFTLCILSWYNENINKSWWQWSISVVFYLEHDFNHVLCPSFQISLVHDVPQSVKNGVDTTWRHFCQFLSTFFQKIDGNFHRIIGGAFKEQGQDLKGQYLVRNLRKFIISNLQWGSE